MNEYIVTIEYEPQTMFDTGKMKMRIKALTEQGARTKANLAQGFPKDGKVIRIREAAYKRK